MAETPKSFSQQQQERMQGIHGSHGHVVIGSRQGPLPPGAIPLTPSQVLEKRLHSVNSWRPREQVWSLALHDWLSAYPSLISAGLIVGQHRLMLNLGMVKMTYSLACSFIPPVMHMMISQRYLRNNLLVNPMQCPPCVMLRGAAISVAFGIIVPYVYSFTLHQVAARMRETAPVPPSFRDWRLQLQLLRRFLASERRLLMLVVPGVAACGALYAGKMQDHSLQLADASGRAVRDLQLKQQPRDGAGGN